MTESPRPEPSADVTKTASRGVNSIPIERPARIVATVEVSRRRCSSPSIPLRGGGRPARRASRRCHGSAGGCDYDSGGHACGGTCTVGHRSAHRRSRRSQSPRSPQGERATLWWPRPGGRQQERVRAWQRRTPRSRATLPSARLPGIGASLLSQPARRNSPIRTGRTLLQASPLRTIP